MGADRPFLVTVIGVLYAIVGVLGLIGGAMLAIGGIAVDEAAAGAAGGGVLAVLGLIYIIIALGFFKGWKLWWYLGVIFAIIGIIAGLISLPAGIVAVIIYLVILWYLFRDNVKAFFLD